MTSHVPADLRRMVFAGAAGICEYCLIAEVDSWYGCQVDHVVSEKHGGKTVAERWPASFAIVRKEVISAHLRLTAS